ALDWRGVGPTGLVDHGRHAEGRHQDAVGVALNYRPVDDLLRHQDDRLGRQGGHLAHTQVAPAVGVPIVGGPLDLKDGHVGLEGRYEHEWLAPDWRALNPQGRVRP